MPNPVHNLDEETAEYFEFILKGHTYRMRYPTTEEIEDASKLKTEQEQNDVIYSYISPQADAPPIKETLAKCNIRYLRKFHEMVKTEFGG